MWSIPRNATPRPAYRFATCTSSGCSSMHGSHHDAHAFTTSTFPAKSAVDRSWPSSDWPLSVGSGSSIARTVVLPDDASPAVRVHAASANIAARTAIQRAARTPTTVPNGCGSADDDGAVHGWVHVTV